MQSVANRRTFVRQIAVAVPVLATTSLPRIGHAAGRIAHESNGMSPELAATLHGLAVLHNELRQRKATVEDARRIGIHIRAIAAERLQHGRDAALVSSVQAMVERRGRDTLFDRAPDIAMMRHELTAFGFEQPLATVGVPSVADREAALQRLLRSGLTATYLDASLSFEMVVAEGGDSCATLREMKTTIEAMAALMCVLSMVLPALAPECFAATSVLAMLAMAEYLFCH